MEVKKRYVNLEGFRIDSYALAENVITGFYPDYMVALWRGGAIPGICMHETFKWYGEKNGLKPTDHIAIRTSKYTGIDQANEHVEVHNLGYLVERLKPESRVLLIDDIFDTGNTIEAVITALKQKLGDNMPNIKVATIYYKPTRNQTKRHPDYYIHETTEWIVFPHEVEGMTVDEIRHVRGKEIGNIFQRLASHVEK